ncbi:MAG TPA: thioredoxin family protein [Bacteroidales bacterium]|nr:thioredoxin family protein [Bacteroidales bacterium]HQI71477.1 thioredoxin family protein [Bacteroidales bacterium]
MKKIILSVLIMVTFFADLLAQEMCQRVFDEKSQKDILVGACTREGILACAFAEDYTIEYPAYQPVDSIVSQLKNLIGGLKCVIVLGTWCGDSKEQVPRFFKILDQAGDVFDKLEIFCVDRQKEVPGMEIKTNYNIEKVPTFIFFRDDTEIGRIVETPKTTLEKDLLDIILGK